jgi:hypothetical protein
MKRMILAGVAALAMLGAGCIESRMVVNVNKDGTGTIVTEDFMSPQMTGMMESFSQMGAVSNAVGSVPDPLAMFADQIEKKGAELGGKAKLTKKEAKTNAAGWKGFALTYSFDDVAQVLLPIGGGDKEKDTKENFKVEFKPGSPAVLRLVPPPQAAATPSAAPAEADTPPGMDAQMGAMMGPMLAGMRISMEIRVNGKIVKSDAPNLTADKKGVTIFDIPMDKLVGNPEAMKLLMNKTAPESEKMGKLVALKLDGVKVTDSTKPITIEFE